MSLRDYKPDESNFDMAGPKKAPSGRKMKTSGYHEEINTLKIDKLSNRVTIISIILPCIIGAILVFAYLDMKERVVDVDETKNSQVERISQILDEKLNALEVRVAKNRFDIDKDLPEMVGLQTAIQGKLAKIFSEKADEKEIQLQISKINQMISGQAKTDKSTAIEVQGLKKSVNAAMSENKKQLQTQSSKIQDEINLFKEEFDARLLELSQYQEQMGELGKNLSLLDKKVRRIEEETINETKMTQVKSELTGTITKLENQVRSIDKKLTANFSRLQKDIDMLIHASSVAADGPKPQLNMDSSGSGSIEKKPLTQ